MSHLQNPQVAVFLLDWRRVRASPKHSWN